MKREGRQHEMPTAGQYTKVPAKPTNHSKFTGKCGTPRCVECHTLPACKSREKSKGTQKLKSCDVALDHRLITRKGVDKRVGLINVGGSATGILGHLTDRNWDEVNGEMEDDVDGVGLDSSSAW
ncbi:hypothetical protein MRB53_035010 [Persea americana]|uniref:Uncharacterized protein n=1 Tax=Persea americana TaxID=3435 RepID=A0ACC2K3F3_PERAE|nr:hypothetical protein MRB53_035010 [Persea americana]